MAGSNRTRVIPNTRAVRVAERCVDQGADTPYPRAGRKAGPQGRLISGARAPGSFRPCLGSAGTTDPFRPSCGRPWCAPTGGRSMGPAHLGLTPACRRVGITRSGAPNNRSTFPRAGSGAGSGGEITGVMIDHPLRQGPRGSACPRAGLRVTARGPTPRAKPPSSARRSDTPAQKTVRTTPCGLHHLVGPIPCTAGRSQYSPGLGEKISNFTKKAKSWPIEAGLRRAEDDEAGTSGRARIGLGRHRTDARGGSRPSGPRDCYQTR
jgi:hypothetical protein